MYLLIQRELSGSLAVPGQPAAPRRISFVAVSNLQIPGQAHGDNVSTKSDQSSHTYVYELEDYAELHQLTVEAFPSIAAYEPADDVQRPTLDDIMEGKGIKDDKLKDADAEGGDSKKGKVRLPK